MELRSPRLTNRQLFLYIHAKVLGCHENLHLREVRA